MPEINCNHESLAEPRWPGLTLPSMAKIETILVCFCMAASSAAMTAGSAETIAAQAGHPSQRVILAGLWRDYIIGEQRRVSLLRALLRRRQRLDPARGSK